MAQFLEALFDSSGLAPRDPVVRVHRAVDLADLSHCCDAGRRERSPRVRRRRAADDFGPAVLALALIVVAFCILAVAAAVLARAPAHCPAECACEIRQE